MKGKEGEEDEWEKEEEAGNCSGKIGLKRVVKD